MKPKIYIAGPINAAAFDAVRARNRRTAAWLEACGFEPIDPLDFEGVDKLQGEVGGLDGKAVALGLVTDDQIVTNCLRLLEQADGVLFQLDELDSLENHVWGTPCEMAYANFVKHIPCVSLLGETTFRSAWLTALSTCVQHAGEAEHALWEALEARSSRAA